MNGVICVACFHSHRIFIFIMHSLRDHILGNLEKVRLRDEPHQFLRLILGDLIQVDVSIHLASQDTACSLKMNLGHLNPSILTSWLALLNRVNSFTKGLRELGMVESLV